jgi:capsule polysaccharide export protein KpsE/RkpR
MNSHSGYQNGSPVDYDLRPHVGSTVIESGEYRSTEMPHQATTIAPVDSLAIPNWVTNASVLWERRHFLLRVAGISLMLSLLIAFAIPKRYKSSAQIMPPSNSSASTAMLAALAGRSLGGLGGLSSLAGSLLGGNNSTALFVDLLRSGTVANHLIDRFQLQQAYHKRYRIDTARYLARHTSISDDKKSGVITITVEDTYPRRARDIAQGYLDELNLLVNHTSTSSAHQERMFIEKRLEKVRADLEQAQQQMSEFSSTHSTIDIKEQARAMVDAASRLEAQLIVEQSSLDSLRQIYGDDNIRVRAAQVRVGLLKRQLSKMSGSSAPLSADGASEASGNAISRATNELYPSLRQLPRLAVPYANLYRKVQVQETVFELLTQQYELAHIQEAKDIPVISVIDAPGLPEKKSFPPRLLVTLLLTLFSTAAAAVLLLFHHRWMQVNPNDPRRLLAQQIFSSLQTRSRRQAQYSGGA